MKKITLLLVAAFIGVTSFAQVELTSVIGEGVSVQAQINAPQAPCSKEETSPAVENGFGNLAGNEVGDNFTLADSETFTILSATVRVILDPNSELPDATVRFYEGDGEFPGALVSENVLAPTSQEVIETLSGFDVRELVFDFDTPVVLAGTAGSETTFWVSVFTPNTVATSNFLQTTTDTDDTTLAAFRTGDDPAAAWANEFQAADGSTQSLEPAVYFILSGDCETLGVGDNALSQVSVYPNPASDVLNIQTPASVEVKSAAIYDVLGKRSNVSLTNGQINVANLAKGVYILSLDTSAGTLTQKIVKK